MLKQRLGVMVFELPWSVVRPAVVKGSCLLMLWKSISRLDKKVQTL